MSKFNIVIVVIFSLFASNAFAENSEEVSDKLYKKYLKEWSKTDFTKSSIDYSRIIEGGPKKDGIPSIDNPIFKTVDEIDNIRRYEPVITVYLNGEARAYPLRILLWHEIINDKIGNTPIAVTYCPLCNSSIVFERLIDGEEVEFGSTGKLYKSNRLMYDRKTESWWQQYTGDAVVGDMIGRELNKVISKVESFHMYRLRQPNGKVLVPNDIIRSYGASPYPDYDSATIPYLYDGEYKGEIAPMEYVVVVGDEAWPLKTVRRMKQIEHNDIVLFWRPLQNSVLDNFNISLSRDIGNVSVIKKVEEGLFKDTNYVVTFAFVFDAFHPNGVMHHSFDSKP
ncbi:MAG: DUF3179 domain-containing protein [Rickettsiales bacterium]|nr:DUF3179 domain-containing protein [Pseudomonadota bacterium]MDA0966233.1 DUF3179 domain-containing protein [Pseudomonadota bacterium]MDG4543102.1 DUF3179 domain-containing protein [Rickettsiales bacterium]MDG4545300.1 DUF3179 domain-containing protein [Rickettsiales bacterium]MDG4547749.1 DUF3179 domain-containing protein [Rickettsiales bacterium]